MAFIVLHMAVNGLHMLFTASYAVFTSHRPLFNVTFPVNFMCHYCISHGFQYALCDFHMAFAILWASGSHAG